MCSFKRECHRASSHTIFTFVRRLKHFLKRLKAPISKNTGYTPDKIAKLWKKSWETKFPDFEIRLDPKPQFRCKTCFKIGHMDLLGSWTDVDRTHPTRQLQRHLGKSGEVRYAGTYHMCLCRSISGKPK